MTLMVPLVYAKIKGFNQHWADVDVNAGMFIICLCSVIAKKPAMMEFFPEEKRALVHLPFMMKAAYTGELRNPLFFPIPFVTHVMEAGIHCYSHARIAEVSHHDH